MGGFKSFIILGVFLVLDMSCYNIGYIKGLFISLVVGTQLENIYQLVHYFIIEWLYKKKKKIEEILEREHIEVDDDVKGGCVLFHISIDRYRYVRDSFIITDFI